VARTRKHHDASLAAGAGCDKQLGSGIPMPPNAYIFDKIQLQTFLPNEGGSQHAFENEALRYSIRKQSREEVRFEGNQAADVDINNPMNATTKNVPTKKILPSEKHQEQHQDKHHHMQGLTTKLPCYQHQMYSAKNLSEVADVRRASEQFASGLLDADKDEKSQGKKSKKSAMNFYADTS